jgi:hypothetical protein
LAAPAIAQFFNGVKFTIRTGDLSQRRIVASGGRRLGTRDIRQPEADGAARP